MPLEGIPGVSKGFGTRPQTQRSALFHAGDRVRHRSFGYGTVTEVRQEGKLVVVDFGERFGLKVMAADTAPMTLAEE